MIPSDIPALRRLKWGVVLALAVMTVFLAARLYFAFEHAEAVGGLELTLMIAAPLALALYGAAVSGHLTRLKKTELAAAKRRLAMCVRDLPDYPLEAS